MKRGHPISSSAIWITISISEQRYKAVLFFHSCFLYFILIPSVAFYWIKRFNDSVKWSITVLISGLRISASFNQCNNGLQHSMIKEFKHSCSQFTHAHTSIMSHIHIHLRTHNTHTHTHTQLSDLQLFYCYCICGTFWVSNICKLADDKYMRNSACMTCIYKYVC